MAIDATVQGGGPWAVIMARGISRRMGRPKGSCRVPGGEQTFLTTIVRRYHEAGFPVAVVTTDSGLRSYQGLVPAGVPVEWIASPAGQDTAWSVFLAWTHLGARATCLWLHPVDLPLVSAETLTTLMAAAESHPDRVLRPVYRDQEGHPVVIPTWALAASVPLGSAPPSGIPGPMREILKKAVQRGLIQDPVLVPVSDAGVVSDFDRPGDFEGSELQERQPRDDER